MKKTESESFRLAPSRPRARTEPSSRSGRIAFAVAAVLLTAPWTGTSADPAEASPPTDQHGASPRSVAVGPRWRLQFSPSGDLYRGYVADPRRPTFVLARMRVSRVGIADAGSHRIDVRIGGRYGLLRFHPVGQPGRGFQLDAHVGFLGQFDSDHGTDNIGWDGLYGMDVAWAGPRGVALRLGVAHDSSHVGDEHAERTGRRRIAYTRQELRLGLSLPVSRRARLYAEGAWGYDLRNETLMEPGRAQAGFEYSAPRTWWKGRLGWYLAADVTAYEESDWDAAATVQLGLYVPVEGQGRSYRFALEYYDGRSWIGEFFQDDERYVSLGLRFDL